MPNSHGVTVEVGRVAVELHTTDPALVEVLERRFRRFLNPSAPAAFRFDITVVPDGNFDADADLQVHGHDGQWTMRRGDFHAEWNVAERRGHIWQTLNPYAIDSILRIVHTLVLSTEGGFLLHASSAVRAGRAFLFTGPSGAGKSTIVGLAPDDVTVLTDEISYLRRTGDGYVAFGTPFAGELSDVGEPVSAPVAGLFQLGRGADNRHEPLGAPETVQTLMRNILFFAGRSSAGRSRARHGLRFRVVRSGIPAALRARSTRLEHARMNRVVVRGDKLAARKVAGEMVILSAEDSSLLVLNEVGTAIWEAADGRTPLQAIAEAVCREYDVEPDVARRDVDDFVQALADAGIVTIREEVVGMTGSLMDRIRDRAVANRIPLAVHFDLTYRCNERCVHCYLDHDDHGEMTTAEVKDVLDQLGVGRHAVPHLQRRRAAAPQGLLRAARLRAGAAVRRQAEDQRDAHRASRTRARIRDLGVRQVQISVYSHRPEVHDGITKVRGSLERTLAAIRFLTMRGLQVTIANVLMRQNASDYQRRPGAGARSSARSTRSIRRSRRKWTAIRRRSLFGCRRHSC